MASIYGRIKDYIAEQERAISITENINLDMTKKQRRILICYLDYKLINKMMTQGATHTNISEMFQIIKVLIELNFIIDVCSFDGLKAIATIKNKEYDMIFGMGETFRQAIALHPEAYSLIYMTENPYDISSAREKERIAYFEERKHIKTRLERTGKFYHKNDEKLANAVLCMGEKEYYKESTQKVYRIFPTAMKNKKFINTLENKRKNSFLVFGTGGFIHKGNDLLFEVFEKHPEWTLYICGQNLEKDRKKVHYFKPDNIIDCGFISVDSEQFLKLVQECTFILLPSCSEGMPTGVMTGMCHGLIPLVSRGIGMNQLEDYCYYFEDYHIDAIESKLQEILKESEEILHKKSDEIIKYANQMFMIENYTNSLKRIFIDIMENEIGEKNK